MSTYCSREFRHTHIKHFANRTTIRSSTSRMSTSCQQVLHGKDCSPSHPIIKLKKTKITYSIKPPKPCVVTQACDVYGQCRDLSSPVCTPGQPSIRGEKPGISKSDKTFD